MTWDTLGGTTTISLPQVNWCAGGGGGRGGRGVSLLEDVQFEYCILQYPLGLGKVSRLSMYVYKHLLSGTDGRLGCLGIVS